MQGRGINNSNTCTVRTDSNPTVRVAKLSIEPSADGVILGGRRPVDDVVVEY